MAAPQPCAARLLSSDRDVVAVGRRARSRPGFPRPVLVNSAQLYCASVCDHVKCSVFVSREDYLTGILTNQLRE